MADVSLLDLAVPEEVVTRALVRDVETPDGAATAPTHAGQRARPHPAETFGRAGADRVGDVLDVVCGPAPRSPRSG